MRTVRGYTLIELLVVMAALGVLLVLAAPQHGEHVERSRETVLRSNLVGLRDAIDKFYADRGRYPRDLAELVVERYLRQIPPDPVTGRSDSWLPQPPADGAQGVFDVRSGAAGLARDGSPYAAW